MKFKQKVSLFLALIITVTFFTSCGNTSNITTQNSEATSFAIEEINGETANYLSNPNATKEARILYNYIREVNGNNILAGQQESTWMSSPEYEMDYIMETTGKLPAIRGLDYINDDFDGVTTRAVEWWEKGGIVSICWHWGTPPDGVGYQSSLSEIDLDEALTEGTDLYNGMIKQMDRVAEELLKLQEAGVPVLWRPFHEFDGAWFWWGKGGAENFKELWKLMYDRYTNYFGLNNLIWVLGYSHDVKDGWYPGREYIDIAGADNYATGTQHGIYTKVKGYVNDPEVPLAYHECGPIPKPADLIKRDVRWVWFLTWHTTHIMEENKPEDLNEIYNDPYVITLDELPDFKNM